VFGKLLNQCPVPFWPFSAQVVAKAPWLPFMLFEIKGDAFHFRPIPLTFLCGYAAPVHGKTSLSEYYAWGLNRALFWFLVAILFRLGCCVVQAFMALSSCIVQAE
jgi:hypothetical protein